MGAFSNKDIIDTSNIYELPTQLRLVRLGTLQKTMNTLELIQQKVTERRVSSLKQYIDGKAQYK